MKKVLFFVVAVMAMLSFTSCNDPQGEKIVRGKVVNVMYSSGSYYVVTRRPHPNEKLDTLYVKDISNDWASEPKPLIIIESW